MLGAWPASPLHTNTEPQASRPRLQNREGQRIQLLVPLPGERLVAFKEQGLRPGQCAVSVSDLRAVFCLSHVVHRLTHVHDVKAVEHDSLGRTPDVLQRSLDVRLSPVHLCRLNARDLFRGPRVEIDFRVRITIVRPGMFLK